MSPRVTLCGHLQLQYLACLLYLSVLFHPLKSFSYFFPDLIGQGTLCVEDNSEMKGCVLMTLDYC